MSVWRLTRKDLLLLLRDRYALILMIGMPLSITGIVCSAAFQLSDSSSPSNWRWAVVDLSRSDSSRRFVQALEGYGEGIRQVQSLGELKELVWRDGWSAGVIVGPRFGDRIEEVELIDLLDLPGGRLSGGLENFDLQVVHRLLRHHQGLVVSQLVFAKLLQMASDQTLEASPFIRAYVEANKRDLTAGGEPASLPLGISGFAISRKDMYRILIPAQAVLFAFFLVNVMARSFVAERSAGTLLRLRMAPISDTMLILGKTLPFFCLSVVQGVLLFATASFVFGMPLGGSPAALLLVIVCTSLAASGLGLLIAVWVVTDYQVNVVATFLVLVMAGISGCLMPREFIPPLMKSVSLVITPHAWSLLAYEQLLAPAGVDWGTVYLSCFWLIIVAAGYFAVSLCGLKQRDLRVWR